MFSPLYFTFIYRVTSFFQLWLCHYISVKDIHTDKHLLFTVYLILHMIQLCCKGILHVGCSISNMDDLFL